MAYCLKYGRITGEYGDVVHGSPGVALNESDEPLFLIRAQDIAAVPAVKAYMERARDTGASRKMLNGVQDSIVAITEWQAANPERLKVPD